MKRLFEKFSRSRPRPADETEAAFPGITPDESPAETSGEAPTTPRLPEPIPVVDGSAPGFELREPTPEEMAATILSRQDFIDIDRMFAGDTPKRMVSRAKASVLSPAVTIPKTIPVTVPRTEPPVASPPGEAPAADMPPAAPAAMPEKGSIPEPAPAVAAAPQPDPVAAVTPVAPAPDMPLKAPLAGFLEGFVQGQAIGGWAGDPDDPTSRNLRVAALVDDKEVGSVIADRERKDTQYAGFQIPFTDPLIWQYVLENRLTVQVAREGEQPMALLFLPNVINQARQLSEEHEAAKPPQPRNVTELSYVRLPVGFESRDAAAIIGRDGFLFDNRDPSNLASQYAAGADRDETIQHAAARWFALFRARETLLTKQGIAYLQTVLPEKATILHDVAPAGFGPITARLGVLETMFEAEAKREGSAPARYYRSLIPALRSCNAAGVIPYLRTGSGLRTAGTQLIFYQLSQKLAALSPAHADALAKVVDLCGQLTPGKENQFLMGDLGKHFDLPVYENEQLPDLERLTAHAAGEANAVERRDSGSRLVWRNPNAVTPIKVIAFGTCFGSGAAPIDLAWWFKAMFGEFHLVESAELDETYVEQHRPDIVVAMSLERHLPSPPAR